MSDHKDSTPEGPSPLPPQDYRPSCGACGKRLDPDEEHDTRACWDKRPCQECHEALGYDYDYERLKRICKRCGNERDLL